MIFLHGGGDHPDFRTNTIGRFIRAATVNAVCNLALIVVEKNKDDARQSYGDYEKIFLATELSISGIHPILLCPPQPLEKSQLEKINPTGVFVCGGSTPLYHQLLCTDPQWVSYLETNQIPYGGTSAGAAVAANQAILGGWRTSKDGVDREILFQGAGEGLDQVTVQSGLDLVPFGVDVHASQMGTLTRLLHAVESGLVATGWAIDENTIIQVEQGVVSVYGQGQAYQIWRDECDMVRVKIHRGLRV
ncbi:MAG: hypothetical protein AAF702_07160 [Chloroflexota bacterium]